jgi:O-acetyl-ADP-ribose deacetylase (regulator of RNase III)
MEVRGNLLEASEKYIVHQCNCKTTTPKGLSEQIFKKFPYANVYHEARTPGTIKICGNGKDKRFVVSLFAQNGPGKPTSKETARQREKWFAKCLTELVNTIPKDSTVAFPSGVGCGLAGGDWSHYLNMIEQFADFDPTTIYKL